VGFSKPSGGDFGEAGTSHHTRGGISMKSSSAKIYVTFVVLPLALLFPVAAFGQVEKAWDAHYDSPYSSETKDDHDWAYDIVTDDLGNVYVTGWSAGKWFSSTNEHDFLTIKYDFQGNELWVSRHERTGHDGAYALALDPDANVYVTGFSESDQGLSHDYLTIKYDTDGNELWAARWEGEHVDGATEIVVDELGNAYVTGWSESFGTDMDYLTIKYDTDGDELWVARYNGPGINYSFDNPSAIAIDSQGNVYVTGYSRGDGTGNDYATIKYDTDGNELWVARHDGPYHGSDEAIAVAINASGDVFVTGTSAIEMFKDNYATVKYDADGNEQWAAYSGFNGAAAALGLGSGHVYVTGWRTTNGGDYATIAYDENGIELWAASYDAAGYIDEANDIAVDLDGSVVVTGISYYGDMPDEEDIVTIKYDLNGNELWNQSYDAIGKTDVANAIALDTEGNVCVTGWSDMDYSNTFTTIKYVPTVSLGLTGITPVVAQGGTVRYQVSIANNTSESQDIWAWIKEKLPTGEWAEDYLLPPTNLNLVPDQEGTYTLRTPIPLSALLGPHEYWGYIGADTSAVWDCDMFPFSVYFQRHEHQVKEN
jgi:hypothetical protein